MTRKHLLLMAVGCLLPLAALTAIFVFRLQVSTVLLFGLFLLCPVMHLFMLRDHTGAHDQSRPNPGGRDG